MCPAMNDATDRVTGQSPPLTRVRAQAQTPMQSVAGTPVSDARRAAVTRGSGKLALHRQGRA
jgi:hypothetical protein